MAGLGSDLEEPCADDTEGLIRDLAEALRRHLDDGQPQDDVTLIAIGVEP